MKTIHSTVHGEILEFKIPEPIVRKPLRFKFEGKKKRKPSEEKKLGGSESDLKLYFVSVIHSNGEASVKQVYADSYEDARRRVNNNESRSMSC